MTNDERELKDLLYLLLKQALPKSCVVSGHRRPFHWNNFVGAKLTFTDALFHSYDLSVILFPNANIDVMLTNQEDGSTYGDLFHLADPELLQKLTDCVSTSISSSRG